MAFHAAIAFAASAPSSNTVAIVAVAVTGGAAIVAPLLSGMFLLRSTQRTISGAHERDRHLAEQEVLDRGAVLLREYQNAIGGLRAELPDTVHLPAGWDETVAEV